ncbi:unnamed protein product [Protopolystoma xenopodis]|uniref:Uncharacterized protein n=1 Tax=Protopolystoma xenopodis TaxID=117903 RepID=A0A3S5A197_9PLAT|nr:unnamed protein product [Protopolystoma xenopodis]
MFYTLPQAFNTAYAPASLPYCSVINWYSYLRNELILCPSYRRAASCYVSAFTLTSLIQADIRYTRMEETRAKLEATYAEIDRLRVQLQLASEVIASGSPETRKWGNNPSRESTAGSRRRDARRIETLSQAIKRLEAMRQSLAEQNKDLLEQLKQAGQRQQAAELNRDEIVLSAHSVSEPAMTIGQFMKKY